MKRVVAMIMVMLFVAIVFVGCNNENKNQDKNKKYNVSIWVASDDGEKFIFTPDVKELRVEREYDGKEHRYYVAAFQLPEHPHWSEKWIKPNREGANVFSFDMLYTDTNGKQDGKLRRVKERGEYAIIINASGTSTLWKYRHITLYVTVK